MSHTQKLLDTLTYEELIELKYQIENEIKKRQPGPCQEAYSLKIGDPVAFIHKGVTRFATVIRFNSKTVTVVEQGDFHRTWRVHPSFLRPIRSAHSF